MTVKIKWKPLVFWIAVSLAAGGLGALAGGNMQSYETAAKPVFTPPDIVFPIVWTVLYVLMGISAYLVYVSGSRDRTGALISYAVQLLINILWPLIFFRLAMYGFAFWWLLILIVAAAVMILLFYKVRPLAAYLNLPYLIWLIFAAVLNYSVYTLN